jgi:hypothetical protein
MMLSKSASTLPIAKCHPKALLWLTLGAMGSILVIPSSAIAYDVTKFSLTPNPSNDPPAQKVTQAPKADGKELTSKIFLPRNDKLQRFEFEAAGKFTGQDIRRYRANSSLPMQVNFVDVQNRVRGVGFPPLLFAGYAARQPISLSLYQGDIPMSPTTRAGDPWKVAGSFQMGCTADGKIFGTVGPKVERLSGAIEFTGDGLYASPVRIECESAPNPAAAPSP